MRIFIGISLSKKLQDNLTSWQENYLQKFSASGVRFLKHNNLHITLLPPWHVENSEKVVRLLKREKFTGQFSLLFNEILFMPTHNPKYIWMSGQTPEKLLNVRLQIARVLDRSLERREYKLHATIARVQKNATFVQVQENIHWEMVVKKFTLFQSHLSPKGAEYKILKEFSLM